MHHPPGHKQIEILARAMRKIAGHDFDGCTHSKEAQCREHLVEYAHAAVEESCVRDWMS